MRIYPWIGHTHPPRRASRGRIQARSVLGGVCTTNTHGFDLRQGQLQRARKNPGVRNHSVSMIVTITLRDFLLAMEPGRVRATVTMSHTILQTRKDEAGSVSRVPAHEIETAVVEAVRQRRNENDVGQSVAALDARELTERYVKRVTIKTQSIEIHLIDNSKRRSNLRHVKSGGRLNSRSIRPTLVSVPWTANASPAARGVVHSPSNQSTMSEENREALLAAIAKARVWIEDLTETNVASFAEIARKEGKVERHIRLLAQLAFVSPRIVSAINERAVSSVKVTTLAKAAVPSWDRQPERVRLRASRRMPNRLSSLAASNRSLTAP